MQTSFFPNRLFLIALVGIAQILPAEDLGVCVADYVGIWRVKGSMYNGGDEDEEIVNGGKSEKGNETSNGVFFRISADGSGSVFHTDNGRAVPDGVLARL